MPTDADLRRLFHDAAAPTATIDPDAIIRRSRRRRLPQQLGVGSVLTLAVAGIGVASINGLPGIRIGGTAETAADAPMGVTEVSPFGGADSAVPSQLPVCGPGPAIDLEQRSDLTVIPRFPRTAAVGAPVAGTLTLTNTGTESVTGTASSPMVVLSGNGVQVWHSGEPAETAVSLAPGESLTLGFEFDAIGCGSGGDTLEPGQYELTAIVTLLPDREPARTIGGAASVITLR
jgi:hypothetical protein